MPTSWIPLARWVLAAPFFAGQIGARLHNPEQDHSRTSSYSLEDSAYREFQVKLSPR